MGQDESQAHDRDRDAVTAGEGRGRRGGAQERAPRLSLRAGHRADAADTVEHAMTSGEAAAGAADYDRPPTSQPARFEAMKREGRGA